jgi:hypothetical protein
MIAVDTYLCFEGRSGIFQNIRSNAFYSLSITYLILMRINMRSIQRLVSLLNKMKSKNMKKLKRFNIAMLLIRIIFNMIYRYEVSNYKPGMSFNSIMIAIIQWYLELNTIGLGAFTLYVFILKGIQFLEKDCIREVLETIEFNSEVVTPLQVYMKVQKVLDIRDIFRCSLSFIPCICFGYTFFRASTDIIRFQIEPSMVSILSMVFFLFWFAEVIVTTLVASSAANDSERLLLSLERKIVKSFPDLHPWIQTLDKIKEARVYEYRAYDLFPITRKILLPFISSLLTFTVLFLQMANRLVENQKN